MINIRVESTEDIPQVRTLHERAFAQPGEANVVDKLRENCPDYLALAGEEDGHIVGHFLFTEAVITATDRMIIGMGSAPMAVMPERQKQGIGSSLVEQGLAILRERGCPFVIVLGHPEYYPRFGFERASKHALSSQWEGVPDEAFMVLVMDQGALEGVSGVAKYRDEFDEAM